MRAVYTTNYTDCASNFSGVTVGTLPTPEVVTAGTLLLSIAASSVNPLDWELLDGKTFGPLTFPHGMGCDFVGTVIATNGSKDFQVGDKVFGAGASPGPWSEVAMVSETRASHVPKGITFNDTELATLPVVGYTMYQALEFCKGCFSTSRRAANRSVVAIASGTGGTGTAGVQLAKAFGATHVVTTAGGADGETLMRRLGADRVVDYKTDDLLDVLSEDSIDLFIDNFGYDPDRALRAVRAGGAWVSIMMYPTETMPSFRKPGVTNVTFGANASRTQDLDAMGAMMLDGKLRPVLGRAFAMEQAPAALLLDRHGGHYFGKIGLRGFGVEVVGGLSGAKGRGTRRSRAGPV